MTRGKEELMSHELCAKEWKSNTPKTSEDVILLYLVATLLAKARNTNQGRVEVHINGKDIWRSINATTRVANHFNQDLAAEIIAINKLIKEAVLVVMVIRKKGHGEVR